MGWSKTPRILALSILGGLLIGCSWPVSSSEPPPMPLAWPERVTGMTLRPVGDHRRSYGSATARQTMQRLKAMNANTIAILLDGRMDNLNDRNIVGPDASLMAQAEQALKDARDLGLATILIPHLYLHTGEWRGEIDFPNPQHQSEWWNSYTRFILRCAEVAKAGGASAFSIGVELKALSGDPQTQMQMKTLAQKIRSSYLGKLTYSANWDEAEQVGFWPVVDFIGINGYYPLVPDPMRGAEKIRRRLIELAEKHQKSVVIVEAGYRSSPLSHLKPWEWPEQTEPVVDEVAQQQAWAAALTHWLNGPGLGGIIVWVVPTDPDDPASEPPHGFNPLNKLAAGVIRQAFQKQPIAD